MRAQHGPLCPTFCVVAPVCKKKEDGADSTHGGVFWSDDVLFAVWNSRDWRAGANHATWQYADAWGRRKSSAWGGGSLKYGSSSFVAVAHRDAFRSPRQYFDGALREPVVRSSGEGRCSPPFRFGAGEIPQDEDVQFFCLGAVQAGRAMHICTWPSRSATRPHGPQDAALHTFLDFRSLPGRGRLSVRTWSRRASASLDTDTDDAGGLPSDRASSQAGDAPARRGSEEVAAACHAELPAPIELPIHRGRRDIFLQCELLRCAMGGRDVPITCREEERRGQEAPRPRSGVSRMEADAQNTFSRDEPYSLSASRFDFESEGCRLTVSAHVSVPSPCTCTRSCGCTCMAQPHGPRPRVPDHSCCDSTSHVARVDSTATSRECFWIEGAHLERRDREFGVRCVRCALARECAPSA